MASPSDYQLFSALMAILVIAIVLWFYLKIMCYGKDCGERKRVRPLGGRIVAFDDPASLVHIILGIFASIFPLIGIMITMIYLFYQYIDTEDVAEKKGDLIEYILGILIGAIIVLLPRYLGVPEPSQSG